MAQPAESDRSQRPSERADHADTRTILSQEANPRPPVTDLDDRTCRNQPQPGEMPVLRAGQQTRGCNFESAPATMPDFNTQALYRQAQSQTARLISEQGHGTAVAIGRNENTCFMATAGHNIDQTSRGAGRPRLAEFDNGKMYPAAEVLRDKPNETAIVAVRTGADTARVCNPATFAEDPAARGRGLIAGFPSGTNTLTASPGDTTRTGTYRELNGSRHRDPMPGENVNRPLLGIRAQVHHGNSGGPAYNERGEVRGLVSGAHQYRPLEEAHVTPISRSQMQQYLSRLGLVR